MACSWQSAPCRTQTESRRWPCWTRSKPRRDTTNWDSPRWSSFSAWGFFAGLDVNICIFGKVFLKELLYQQLEEKWNSTQTWAAITIQRNIRGFLCRRNFKFFRQKAIIIQSHIRGHQARYREKVANTEQEESVPYEVSVLHHCTIKGAWANRLKRYVFNYKHISASNSKNDDDDDNNNNSNKLMLWQKYCSENAEATWEGQPAIFSTYARGRYDCMEPIYLDLPAAFHL